MLSKSDAIAKPVNGFATILFRQSITGLNVALLSTCNLH